MTEACVFCAIVLGERAAHVVHQTPSVIAFLDQLRQPSDVAHVLVIPRAHVENIYGIGDALGAELFTAHALVARAIKRAFAPDGITTWSSNGAGANQEVPHFHLHVYPRRIGAPFPPPIQRPETAIADDVLRPSASRIRGALEEVRPQADPRLAAICGRLSELILEVPPLRDLLDLTAGAVASFVRAKQVGYEDRLEPLPDEYYPKLSERVARMAAGTLPPHGRWISGYYFNSGLMRLHAVLDQFERVQETISKRKFGGRRLSASAESLRTDVNRLKHQRTGLGADPRNVEFATALSLLEELISQIGQHRALLTDPAVKVPEMRSGPREKRRTAR